MTVWIYVDVSKEVGDVDHLKVFASKEAAEAWLNENDPIPTGDGSELRSLRDAGIYVLALPPAEAERQHWQVAMELLISAAEKGGILMMAHIAMLRALNHGDPDPAPAPRRKRANRYRIVR